MTKYREILRLSDLGISQSNIAYSCSVSKKTVNKVLKSICFQYHTCSPIICIA